MIKLKQEKKKFVRIQIGMCETGSSGIKAPIKTINIESESSEEVYDELIKLIGGEK